VIAYAPDVVVLEWVANDSDTDIYKKAGEALVRRIKTELPDCRLVFMGFTGVADVDVDDATNTRQAITTNWQELCSHYSIDYVDYAAELYQLINVDGGDLSDYMYDGVHPTSVGHNIAHELVRSTVVTQLLATTIPILPPRLRDCEDFEADPIIRDATDFDSETGTWATVNDTQRQSSEADATITFTDTFVSCGLEFANTGVIQYSMDGGAYSASLDLTLVGPARILTGVLSKVSHDFAVKVISGTVTIEKFIAI